MTSTVTPSTTDAAASVSVTSGVTLPRRPGRWVDGWNPEDSGFWESEGRPIARRNLQWSIFAEFLGFIIWQLWSIVVVMLPAAGFTLTAHHRWLSPSRGVHRPVRRPYNGRFPL